MIASYRRPTPARPAQASADARPFLRWQPPAVDTVHPSCVSPKRIVQHVQQHRASAQVVGSLSRFIRHHVDIFPVLVILPVLHDRQIDRTELIAYRFKVRPIPAVAAVINLLLPGNEQKTGPQRLVTLQPTAGKCRAGSTWTVSSSLAGTACCQSASVISAPSIPQ